MMEVNEVSHMRDETGFIIKKSKNSRDEIANQIFFGVDFCTAPMSRKDAMTMAEEIIKNFKEV